KVSGATGVLIAIGERDCWAEGVEAADVGGVEDVDGGVDAVGGASGFGASGGNPPLPPPSLVKRSTRKSGRVFVMLSRWIGKVIEWQDMVGTMLSSFLMGRIIFSLSDRSPMAMPPPLLCVTNTKRSMVCSSSSFSASTRT